MFSVFKHSDSLLSVPYTHHGDASESCNKYKLTRLESKSTALASESILLNSSAVNCDTSDTVWLRTFDMSCLSSLFPQTSHKLYIVGPGVLRLETQAAHDLSPCPTICSCAKRCTPSYINIQWVCGCEFQHEYHSDECMCVFVFVCVCFVRVRVFTHTHTDTNCTFSCSSED